MNFIVGTIAGYLSGFKMFLLLSCWIITGIMAKEPSFTHYQLKHSSMCLHVNNNPPYSDGRWTFGDTLLVSAAQFNRNYTGKVVYHPGNLSLCINDLTEKDAGTYTVTFYNSALKEFTERHRVIIEEMVPKPVIMMSALPSNLSAGLCNFTVNCSVQHEWASSVCKAHGCRTSQESFSKVNISISTNNRSVVCSGSNHVSKSEASESIDVCFRKLSPKPKEEPQPRRNITTIIVVIIIIAVCVLCGGIVFVVKKRFSATCCHYHEHTARLIQSQAIETQPRPEPRPSTSSSHSEASYENVSVVQVSSQTGSPRQELGSDQSHKVDTVYSILQMLNPSVSRADTNRNETIQEALPSQSVTPEETQQPGNVDTVYSVVQKPKKCQSTT